MKAAEPFEINLRARFDPTAWAAALAIVILGVGLRWLGLGRPAWLDEHATLLTVGESLSQTWTRLRQDTHHPLYFLLFNLWSRMDRDLPFLRGLSLLTDTASVGVMLVWLRRWHARGALYAALFFATAPILLRFGVEMRPYSLLSLATLLTLWATTAVVRTPQSTAAHFGLAAAASVLVATQPVGIIMLAVCACWPALAALRRRQAQRLLPLAAALSVPLAVFGYLHWVWALPHPAASIAWMPAMSWQLFTGVMRYLFIDTSTGVPARAVWMQQGAWAALWLVFFVWSRKGEWRLAALAGGYLLAIAGYSLLAQPIFWYRPLLPALVVLLAHMALQIERLGWGARAVWLMLCAVQAAAWCTHAPMPVEPGVGAVLHSSWHPGDRVLYYPAWMQLYVVDEAGFVPKAAMAPLTPDASQLSQKDTSVHTVHLIMRSELPMLHSRSELLAGLQHWEPLLRSAQEIQLLVVPGHDLDVTGDAGVTQRLVNEIGASFTQPVIEPRDDGLVRVLFKP